jgi:hypothetical protein
MMRCMEDRLVCSVLRNEKVAEKSASCADERVSGMISFALSPG